MLALAYDAALRREELCALEAGDIQPAHRLLRVRAETRMRVGDYTVRRPVHQRVGQPLAPRTMATELSAVRTLFWDCQEWGWIPRRFDPGRSLAVPRAVKALIGRKPRVIADAVWARLLWAGLHLEAADLPDTRNTAYPVQCVRALAVVWLFAGLRSDEILRLRVGCVRWQTMHDAPGAEPVCLLDIPTHKTGTDFTKPVDPQVGHAIETWEAVRPHQPRCADRKSAEHVELLFMYRARAIPREFINHSIIPTLCRKAGVARSDVRGNITSHRARATIASQLFNSREPMSLFEPRPCLGHAAPWTRRGELLRCPPRGGSTLRPKGKAARESAVCWTQGVAGR